MEFLNDCQQYFDTKNLYEILGVSKNSTLSQIKTAYRKKSLKVHPDHAKSENAEYAKRAFQILAKVHSILTNEESRKVYDENGMIITEDNCLSDMSNFDEFLNYWRAIFPKIDKKQIDDFAKNYIGSEEEKKDLKTIYLKFEGDLDKIYENHFFYDEDRICQLLSNMIEQNEIPDYPEFSKEKKTKKQKRLKKIEKEAKLAEIENKPNETFDLVKAIQDKNSNNFDNLIKNLEAKYGKGKRNKANGLGETNKKRKTKNNLKSK